MKSYGVQKAVGWHILSILKQNSITSKAIHQNEGLIRQFSGQIEIKYSITEVLKGVFLDGIKGHQTVL